MSKTLSALLLKAISVGSLGCMLVTQQVGASSVVWSCSRSEAKPEAFEGVRAFRIDNLSAKDDYGIHITLTDLYGAYSGQTIHMGTHVLSVCSLPAQDPLQEEAMDMLGFSTQDIQQAARLPTSKLVVIQSIHQMQKCIVENHPAIGFLKDVVENERVGPCF
jgi:hypothetical protein